MNSTVLYSDRESRLFGLRFGRATITSDPALWDEVLRAAHAHRLDYLRLKIVNPDSRFISWFKAAAPTADLMGVIRLYKIIISDKYATYSSGVAEYKRVSAADKDILKSLLKETYTEVPLGFYQYPHITADFPIDLQLENVGAYIADHHSGTADGREAYIQSVDGKPVGCFASDFTDGKVAVTLYAGLLAQHRGLDLFQDMIRFFKNLCYNKGMSKAICGARLENLSSQYAMEKEDSIGYGYEWVYMIRFAK